MGNGLTVHYNSNNNNNNICFSMLLIIHYLLMYVVFLTVILKEMSRCLHLKALGEVSLVGILGASKRLPNTCTSKLA